MHWVRAVPVARADNIVATVHNVTNAGDVSVIGGGKYAMYDIVNSGATSFTDAASVAMASIDNSGASSFTNVATLTLTHVANTNDVSMTGCPNVTITDVTNAGSATITLASTTADFVRVVTHGTVSITGGTHTANNIVNRGTLNFNSGALTADIACPGNKNGTVVFGAQATGTVRVETGCKGDMNTVGGVTVTEVERGVLTSRCAAPCGANGMCDLVRTPVSVYPCTRVAITRHTLFFSFVLG